MSIILEAATLKAAAKRLMRDMVDLLSQKNVPEALRKEIEDVRTALKKTWADLETEADGEETMPEMAELIKVRVGAETIALTELMEFWETMHLAEVIKQEGDKWVLYTADGKKKLGEFDTEEDAKKREREINFFKHQKEAAVDVTEKSKGLQFVIGFKKGGGSETQSVLFSKEDWTEDEARTWLDDHDMSTDNMDETENSYRFRQHDSSGYERFRIISPSKKSKEAEQDWQPRDEEGTLLEGDFSQDNVRQILQDAIKPLQQHSDSAEVGPSYPWVKDVWDKYFVYALGNKNYRRTYVIDDKGTVTLGEPEEVVQKTEYIPVAKENVSEADTSAVLMVGEGAANGYNRGPVVMDVVPIEPGWGNKRDNHYYPADVLKRDAHLFEGVKMYLTNHVDEEHTVRNEVAEVLKCPIRFTETGAPVARVGVFDGDFAESVRNRQQLKTLSDLHCSLYGSGDVEEQKIVINGREGKRVKALREVKTLDFVPQAGAGGHVLNIVEMEGIVDETTEKKEGEEEETTTVREDIREKETPPATLDSATVLPLLMEADLPRKIAERLAKRAYSTTEEVQAAITEMKELLNEAQEEGRVHGMGPSSAAAKKDASGQTPQELIEAQHEAEREVLRVHGLIPEKRS